MRSIFNIAAVLAVAAAFVAVGASPAGAARGQPVFHRTGQAVYQVVDGFEGPLIARHGLRDDFDPVAFCAAFS